MKMRKPQRTKIAFANWDNRIAPVFDTARQIHLVEIASGQIVSETEETLSGDLPVQKTLQMVEMGVGALVCGAISRPMYELIGAYGIHVVPFVAGNLQEVIQAWFSDTLNRDAFTMPGCYGRGQRRRWAVIGTYKEEHKMNGKGRDGMGGGRGQGGGMGQGGGQGQGGQGRGRMGGPLAGGAVGTCVCPSCGYSEPHERGVPCAQKPCPKCGTAMTRQ
ncbi:hypothetical protein EHM69_10665 [candidate division KSB1 bacterium]|nr:MAG: hypothetical protein EHM69_10665 [candidate division KSB1 bacterium]